MATWYCLNFFFSFARHYLPVASLAQKLGELLKIVLIRLIKAVGHCTVDVDDRHNLVKRCCVSFANNLVPVEQDKLKKTYLSIHQNRHNDLTLRVTVACDVSRE